MRRHHPHDLGTAVYRAIAQRSPNTEPTSFADALAWFVKAAGGNVSAAARLAGVPRRSMRDWLGGKSTPGAERRAQVAASARLSERRARLGGARETRLRGLPSAGITVVGYYNYDGPPERDAEVGRYMDPGAADQLVDAYLTGADPGELRGLFSSLITQDASGFYPGTMANGPNDDHGWTVTQVRF